jgi:hypothetical protein
MSRIKTSYERIWVCGVVVEEALREGEVTGSNHGNRGASRLYTKKCATCDLFSGVPLLNKFYLLFISSWFRKSTMLAGAYITRQHCGSGVAGGNPPAKIAICAGTRLLACVTPASTNAFWPPVKIVSGLVQLVKFVFLIWSSSSRTGDGAWGTAGRCL